MDNIESLWDNIKKEKTWIEYEWNEAKLKWRKFTFEKNWYKKSVEVLLRKSFIWDRTKHNNEIIEIYDKINQINFEYQEKDIKHRINIINHWEDNKWNIYIKDLNQYGDEHIEVYDLLPDKNYLDPENKDKSKFKKFKKAIIELKLNNINIICDLFRQLAILHSNWFSLGWLKKWDLEITHPVLSLFLYRLDKNEWNYDDKIYIHDIHNLKYYWNDLDKSFSDKCIDDLKNLSYDIINFFKWVWIPQWGLSIYSNILKELNPELHIRMISFLWDPTTELTLSFIPSPKQRKDEDVEIKKSKDLLKKTWNLSEWKEKDIKSFLNITNAFYLKKNKEKILDFLKNINPNNTQFIIDFDNTLTNLNSVNAFNIRFTENENTKLKQLPKDFFLTDEVINSFSIRFWAIWFLKLLQTLWYDFKIYSLWFKDIIQKVLEKNWVIISENDIFANDYKNYKTKKANISIKLDQSKNQIFLWDSISDFQLNWSKENFKIWFLNKDISKIKIFNEILDFYFIDDYLSYTEFFHLIQKLSQ